MLSMETENLVQKNGFVKNGISVKMELLTMCGVLYKQIVGKVLRQQVSLLDGDGLVLQPLLGSVENLDRQHHANGLYFGDIYDTLNRKVMKNEKKEMELEAKG